jgi:lipoprotein NlpD
MLPVRHYVRTVGPLVLVATLGAIVACGDENSHANDTLPPIATTTTTTTLAPTTTTLPDFYVIQRGDSLFAIAQKFGLSFPELAAFNGIENPDDIQAGQKLRIPKPGEVIPTTAAPTTTVAPSVP